MKRDLPRFRADMAGSLLRTAPVKQARAQRQAGQISATQLREVDDKEIRKIIAKQEETGLQAATDDGEFRRAWWHFDFLERLNGVAMTPSKESNFKVSRQSLARYVLLASSALPVTRCWIISGSWRRTPAWFPR